MRSATVLIDRSEPNRMMVAPCGSGAGRVCCERKILMATDFSASAESAFVQAVELVRRSGGELTVAHVVHDFRRTIALKVYALAWGAMSPMLVDYDRALRHEADERLRSWIAVHSIVGVHVRRRVLVGSPVVEIAGAVQGSDYDLLVVGTHRQNSLAQVLGGGTATKLARLCACPVWITRPRQSGPLRNVLVPVDFSDVSREALALAASLADQCGATLHLLHTFELTKLTKTSFNVAPRVAWQAINEMAARVDADLIVIGSFGRGGLPGMLTGSTVEKLLRTAEVPLMVVKPDGFISPVASGPVKRFPA